MKALIYTRVMPNNKHVARSDKLEAQEKRCRELARKLKATVVRVFKDEGAINPSRYMRGIQSILYYLKNQKEEFLVIADHPARIGLTKETQKEVIADISSAGGKFITPESSASRWIEIYGDEIIATLNELECD